MEMVDCLSSARLAQALAQQALALALALAIALVLVLQAVGLPAEAIAILIPIDRALDTVRTMVNVEGDMVGSLVVQKWIKQDE